MGKIAFIFPGQGAQYVGMAMDFAENNPEVKDIRQRCDKKNSTPQCEKARLTLSGSKL